MRIHFNVRNDIVFGLKFVNNVYKMLAKGKKYLIKLIKMRIRWVVLLLRKSLTFLICLGLRLLKAF